MHTGKVVMDKQVMLDDLSYYLIIYIIYIIYSIYLGLTWYALKIAHVMVLCYGDWFVPLCFVRHFNI